MNEPVAILIDTTRCTGCEQCVEACKEVNHLEEDQPRPWKQRIDDLSSTRYTTILEEDGHYVRQLCRHCVEPACVSACIVGALQKTALGPVTYDSNKCMGCRYCMMACPYGIPRYAWEDPTPVVQKCTLCYPRVSRGLKPACVEACPYGANSFGTRAEMVKLAHRRIEEAPDCYQSKVYGEFEIGGTSVLYVSDIPLDFLAVGGELPQEPLPELTWAALSKVPSMIAGVGGIMAATWWIVNRRMKLADEAADEAAEQQQDENR